MGSALQQLHPKPPGSSDPPPTQPSSGPLTSLSPSSGCSPPPLLPLSLLLRMRSGGGWGRQGARCLLLPLVGLLPLCRSAASLPVSVLPLSFPLPVYFSVSLCTRVSLSLSVTPCVSLGLARSVWVSPSLPLPLSPCCSFSPSPSPFPSMEYRSAWLIKPHYFSEHLPLKFQQMARGGSQRLGLPRPRSLLGTQPQGQPGSQPTPHLCGCQTCLHKVSAGPAAPRLWAAAARDSHSRGQAQRLQPSGWEVFL